MWHESEDSTTRKIFISYRRDDSIVIAKLVCDELEKRFDEKNVFMDINDIGYGDNFVQAINDRLEWADVVVVVIGPRWMEMLQQRLRGDDARPWQQIHTNQTRLVSAFRHREGVSNCLQGQA